MWKHWGMCKIVFLSHSCWGKKCADLKRCANWQIIEIKCWQGLPSRQKKLNLCVKMEHSIKDCQKYVVLLLLFSYSLTIKQCSEEMKPGENLFFVISSSSLIVDCVPLHKSVPLTYLIVMPFVLRAWQISYNWFSCCTML